MVQDRVVKAPDPRRPAAEVPAGGPAPERRPFAPPAVQELGELKELTQQFGGTL